MTRRRSPNADKILTEELIGAICDGYQLGMPQQQAAAVAGVHVSTLRRWIATGDAENERLQPDQHADGPPPKPNPKIAMKALLARRIKEADGLFVQDNLNLIKQAAKGGQVKSRKTLTIVKANGDTSTEVTETFYDGQWTAAAWPLERRHTADFGKQTTTVITGKDGGPLEISVEQEESISAKVKAFLEGVDAGREQPATDPVSAGDQGDAPTV